MCNIAILEKTDNKKITENDFNHLLDYSISKAERNQDGWGIVTDDLKVVKGADALSNKHRKKLSELIVGRKWVLIHVRYATQGKVCHANSQPIETDNYIFLHNGTFKFGGYTHKTDKDAEKSDTVEFAEMVDNMAGKDYLQDISKSLTAVESGSWYKLFIISKRTGKLYFVSNTAGFQAEYIPKHNTVFGSTDLTVIDTEKVEKEGMFIKKVPIYRYSFKPETFQIYKVGDKDWKKCVDVEKDGDLEPFMQDNGIYALRDKNEEEEEDRSLETKGAGFLPERGKSSIEYASYPESQDRCQITMCYADRLDETFDGRSLCKDHLDRYYETVFDNIKDEEYA